MKTCIKNRFLVPVLTATLSLMAVGRGATPSFSVLHDFSPMMSYTNWDGAQPYHSGLVLSGNLLFGTTYFGGTNASGTVFRMNTDGGTFAVLHAFGVSQSPDYTNLDGAYPQGGLTLVGDTLYGTALNGGTNHGGYGTVFSVNTKSGRGGRPGCGIFIEYRRECVCRVPCVHQ